MKPRPSIQHLSRQHSARYLHARVSDPQIRNAIFRSLDRTLSIWLPRSKSVSILDVGCGEGALLLFLQQSGYHRLAGFDLSPENVSLCHQNGLPFVAGFDALNVHDWPGPSYYDVIFAMDILEHIPKASAASFLGQLRERLRPEGGYLVLQFPNMAYFLSPYHRYGDLSHEFGLTEKSALDLLMISGFSSLQIRMRPVWNATTFLGRLREEYLRVLHFFFYLAEGTGRPRIPTRNLLVRAER